MHPPVAGGDAGEHPVFGGRRREAAIGNQDEGRHLIIGTAGHVDHGKTTLVRAVTGVDTDRLPEEKRREMTIDLGFAEFSLPGGSRASIIDVPGHERFVGNMLAGATGIDLVLFVVAADEGVMPQTLEHLDILDLLGLSSGIIVLTKADAVDEDWLEMVAEEVREAVEGTFLAEAPMVAVSARTGKGLDELVRMCDRAVAGAGGRSSQGPARLPVDRVFSVSGFGTVVTGTLTSGRVAVDDRLELLPSGREVRVRGLQVHSRERTEASAGQRVAINLSGVGRADLGRGDVLASPGVFRATRWFDGLIRLVPRAQRPFRSRTRVHLHTGAAEVVGRILLLDRLLLSPGESCLVQFHGEAPLVVGPKDRFVVRSYSPVRVIGGGEVIDPAAPLRRRRPRGRHAARVLAAILSRQRGDPGEALLRLLAEERGPVPRSSAVQRVASELGIAREEVEAGLAATLDDGRVRPVAGGGQVMHQAVWDELLRSAVDWLRGYHRRWPLRRGAHRDELRSAVAAGWSPRRFAAWLDSIADAGTVTVSGEHVAAAGFEPRPSGEMSSLLQWIEAEYAAGGASPPAPEELAPRAPGGGKPRSHAAEEATMPFYQAFEYLVETGVLVKLDGGVYFSRDQLSRIESLLVELINENGAVTVSKFRQLIKTSRKYAVPLLEYFDRQRITRREGDLRRPGPAAADKISRPHEGRVEGEQV